MRTAGIYTLRNTICAKIVTIISEITEKIDQKYFGLKLKWFIILKNLSIEFKEDRHCAICHATKTLTWHRHSEPGQYICRSCYHKQNYIKKQMKYLKENESKDKNN